jgi:hypothetical protein
MTKIVPSWVRANGRPVSAFNDFELSAELWDVDGTAVFLYEDEVYTLDPEGEQLVIASGLEEPTVQLRTVDSYDAVMVWDEADGEGGVVLTLLAGIPDGYTKQFFTVASLGADRKA